MYISESISFFFPSLKKRIKSLAIIFSTFGLKVDGQRFPSLNSITQNGSNPNGNFQISVAYLGPLANITSHLE